MSHARLAAGSSRCLLHACTGFRPREALPSMPYSTCGVTLAALVSVQPSLNTCLHWNLAVPRSNPLEVTIICLRNHSKIYGPGIRMC